MYRNCSRKKFAMSLFLLKSANWHVIFTPHPLISQPERFICEVYDQAMNWRLKNIRVCKRSRFYTRVMTWNFCREKVGKNDDDKKMCRKKFPLNFFYIVKSARWEREKIMPPESWKVLILVISEYFWLELFEFSRWMNLLKWVNCRIR